MKLLCSWHRTQSFIVQNYIRHVGSVSMDANLLQHLKDLADESQMVVLHSSTDSVFIHNINWEQSTTFVFILYGSRHTSVYFWRGISRSFVPKQSIAFFFTSLKWQENEDGRSVDCNQAGFVTKQEEIPTHSCFERFSVCHLIFPHLYFDLVVLCICQEHWLERSICIIKNTLKR